MGCGCGKKKRKPLTPKQKEAIRARSKAALQKKQKADKERNFRNKIVKARLNICEKCSHSVQTDRDKKYNLRICHKQNRPINVVASKLEMSCPVGKFKSST